MKNRKQNQRKEYTKQFFRGNRIRYVSGVTYLDLYSVSLSGGERQRISIARALLRGTPVLLMDEATASLDAATAYQVSSAVLALEGMTRVVIKHRLEDSLLRRYDCILVMKDGQICEQGSFDELMQKQGRFYSMVQLAR